MKTHKIVILNIMLCIVAAAEASTTSSLIGKPLFTLIPTTPTGVHVPAFGNALVEYQVTNQSKRSHTLTLIPQLGASQNVGLGLCPSPFLLNYGQSCLLSLSINRAEFTGNRKDPGPQVCQANPDNTPNLHLCYQPNTQDVLKILPGKLNATDPDFPYGASPQGNVCVTSDYYATPETMLGSWAMIQALDIDIANQELSSLFNANNTVYGVGTAALGDQLGIPNCSGGCNDLNGYCFAIKFNNKPNYPYMIFQSVNIGANSNSFDIYMAGGGSGAFPTFCKEFWGTGDSVNWGMNIENSSCDSYFNGFTTIQSQYSVTYKGVHDAKQTLIDACHFASANQTGFNTQNWTNLSVVPVTCPGALTQVTGLALPGDMTKVGNQTIYSLKTITDTTFQQSSLSGITTTQMQDCKTPSSGYCGNVPQSIPNYEASISASLTTPLLSGSPPPSTNYCTENPTFTGGFCSWSQGQSSGGGYCNQSEDICFACTPHVSEWCTCNAGTLVQCIKQP